MAGKPPAWMDDWVSGVLAKLAVVVHQELAGLEDWPEGMSCVFESHGIAVRLTVVFCEEWEEVGDGT